MCKIIDRRDMEKIYFHIARTIVNKKKISLRKNVLDVTQLYRFIIFSFVNANTRVTREFVWKFLIAFDLSSFQLNERKLFRTTVCSISICHRMENRFPIFLFYLTVLTVKSFFNNFANRKKDDCVSSWWSIPDTECAKSYRVRIKI